ncbi:MAG: formylglycine-generating enzyme family protein [Planctomycetota bacterium]
MRLILLYLSLSLTSILSAREWPLWDNHESVESYAKRVNLALTKTLDLSNGVKLELVLIPAGKFVMGTPEPEFPDTIRQAILLILIGGILLIGVFVKLWLNYRKSKRRNFSLGWLLLLTITGGLFAGTVVRSFVFKDRISRQYQHDMRIFEGLPDNEKPAHTVTISRPLYMGKYPITREQYVAVMGNFPVNNYPSNSRHPVAEAKWDDSMAFCDKCKVQLPTEAQWEFACRAGTTTRFYSGDTETDLMQVGWYDKNSGYWSQKVGMKSPNLFGLYDMHGNVWQWCEDGQRVYRNSTEIDPKGPTSPKIRHMMRGGSRDSNSNRCRSTQRESGSPDHRRSDSGFRVILPVPE